jgi:hypothetical protein
MKLKKIIENLDKMPSTMKGFDDKPKLSSDQKRELMDMVAKYNELGEKIRMGNSLIEAAQSIAKISEMAEIYACNEQQDWFDEEVVRKDFKRAKNVSSDFQKVAKECHSKMQQLTALFEDFGTLLGRYYEIKDPVQEVNPNGFSLAGQRELPNANSGVMDEVTHNDKNVKSQRCLPSGGPAKAQVKEVTHNDKNIKSQKNLPSGGPAVAQVKEVTHNDSNLQSQRELPQGGPESYTPPCACKDDDYVTFAGAGEMNVKGERDEPQGGPAKTQVKEVNHNTSNLQSQRRLPSMGDIMRMK